MESYTTLLLILLIGFAIYYLLRDKLFDLPDSESDSDSDAESFRESIPAPSSIEVRQAPLYPPQQVSSSGPNPPNQTVPTDEITVHSPPRATDPYDASYEHSDHPEKLRHPERSFRAPPMNDHTQVAVQAGIASSIHPPTADRANLYAEEMIQNGGELMPGIFANDTFDDQSYSAF